MSQKCLFIITGDNFRLGPQRSPKKGGKHSIARQKIASESHIELADYLSKNFNRDVEFLTFTV